MKRFWQGFLLGIVTSVAVPLLVIAAGFINFAATSGPSSAEAAFAEFAIERSMAWRVPNTINPYAADTKAITSGFHHYADTCLACHGAPGVPPKEFAKGLNPPAPDLTKTLNERSDNELFWIVKNGIRMTGMPALDLTHTDDDIWKIVSFVRELPNLSEEQQSQLRETLGSGHEHSGTDRNSEPQGHHVDSIDHAH
ncbi:c-type cytochrome [Planctomycetes bacterium TBK1r]|uniref:Cytochrome c domain-containing protein n=1 Tax=Stieleria magnilauensis TaxID=2527963 RepID=A0ABX5XTS7_9BACT|nr:hypothetical protein TBK1r_44090 [Planctomycetes bacterium TBK1r]